MRDADPLTPTLTLDGVDVHHGDCLTVLRTLPDNSVDSVVTDPPYGLSNTKPSQVADVLAAWVTGDTEVVPAGKGFMGKTWDSFVPPPAVWSECLRVLKPGGHMAVFSGARTQDLMGLSIRLAGFEIRDTLGWITGSGFPKSMDVSKAIDKGQAFSRSRAYEFTEWMRSTGITAKQISEATGTAEMGGHLLAGPNHSQPAVATADLFDKLRHLLPEVPERIERLVAERTGIEWADYVKREVVGKYDTGLRTGDSGVCGHGEGGDITAPASAAAKQWSGWGTALKPAIEPIILARKPLDGTVAQNVLEHGVGGLNIDASRVGTEVRVNPPGSTNPRVAMGDGWNANAAPTVATGRFPANVLLDERAAVEMDKQNRVGASRFFHVFKYQPKAPRKERPAIARDDGSTIQHPTVKPLALMEWLVTLITPPGGRVLDPFAGTGTTLHAARGKGFRAIGIEQSADYIQLVNARLRRAALSGSQTFRTGVR